MHKKLKVGELVQIWDHSPDPKCGVTLTGHGDIGYLIENQAQPGKITSDGKTAPSGAIWKVICFAHELPVTYYVHEDWLRPINKSDDIKKKT